MGHDPVPHACVSCPCCQSNSIVECSELPNPICYDCEAHFIAKIAQECLASNPIVWYVYAAYKLTSQMLITKNLFGNWSAGLRQQGDSTKRPAAAKAIEAKVKNLFCEDSSQRLPPQSLCKPTGATFNQMVPWSGLHLYLEIYVFEFFNILNLGDGHIL